MSENDMVERVRAAIVKELDCIDCGDGTYLIDSYYSVEELDKVARAAIEAMREPTDAMVDYAWKTRSEGMDPRRVFRAMIDAALKG